MVFLSRRKLWYCIEMHQIDVEVDFDYCGEKNHAYRNSYHDMMDYDEAYLASSAHIEVLGYKFPKNVMHIFNSKLLSLDGESNEQSFIYNKSNLLLVQILLRRES